MKKLIKQLIINLVPEYIVFWRKRGCKGSVALTFDDGPNCQFTPQVLDILKRDSVKATFFLVGNQIEAHPQLFKRIVEDGHSVGMHTFTHEYMRNDSNNFEIDLDRCRDIFKLHGVEPRFFRPPYGKFCLRQIVSCFKRSLQIAIWSIDCCDFKFKDYKSIVSAVLDNPDLGGGSVILCHYDNQFIVDALPKIIDGIRAHGLSFVTLEEMFR